MSMRHGASKIGDRGARACNEREAGDEPPGPRMNYATGALAEALRCLDLATLTDVKKAVIACARLPASPGAVRRRSPRLVLRGTA